MVQRLRPWCVVLLVALASSACGAPPPADTPTEAAAPTAEATAEPERLSIDEAGISLVPPQGWSVAGPFAVEAGGVSFSLYTLGTDPGDSGGPGMSQIILADAGQVTAEAFVASQCSTCPSNPFVDMQLGGLPARRTSIGGGGVPFTVDWVFVERGGRLIGFSMRDPDTLAMLEEVLESVRFDDLPS